MAWVRGVKRWASRGYGARRVGEGRECVVRRCVGIR